MKSIIPSICPLMIDPALSVLLRQRASIIDADSHVNRLEHKQDKQYAH